MGMFAIYALQYLFAIAAVVYALVGAFRSGGILPLLMLPVMLAILLPPAREKLKSKLGFMIPPGHSLWVAFALWFTQMLWFANIQTETEQAKQAAAQAASQKRVADVRLERRETFAKDRQAILAKVQGLVAEDKAPEALAMANLYLSAGVTDADLGSAKESASLAVFRAELANEGALSAARRVEIYQALLKAEPGSVAQYSAKLKTAQAEVAAEAAAAAKVKARQEFEASVKSQFSGWDGSHRGVEEAIKARMNNPKSYEHVQTRYLVEDGFITVLTSFRGSNAFGGVVTNTAVAKVSANGQVISISIN